MHNFERLTIWQDAQDLAVDIYKAFADNRDFGLRDQIQRAAVSISNNIAEGSEYDSDNAFIRYLNIAKGSCSEVRSMLYLCHRINYLDSTTAENYIEKSKKLSSKITNFITQLEQNNENCLKSKSLKVKSSKSQIV